MTVEQHAEAAAEEIDRSMTDGPKAIIAKHMQSAIDEATAPLRARIAHLEGLGPLIEEYRQAFECLLLRDTTENHLNVDRVGAQIKAILKGGAS